MGLEFWQKLFAGGMKPAPVEAPPARPRAPGLLTGIDVSHHNGFITWGKPIRGVDPKFAFCKATQGISFVDTQFKNNWKNAIAAGVPIGAYHFFEPSLDGRKQAEHFLKQMGTNLDGHLSPVLDWEPVPGRKPYEVIAGVQRARAKDFLDLVERETGRVPMIYGANYFMKDLGLDSSWTRYPLWVANYKVPIEKVKIPPPWTDWVVWQMDEHPIDTNVFRGDMDDLREQLMGIPHAGVLG